MRTASPQSRALSAFGLVPRLLLPMYSQREGQEELSRGRFVALSLALFLGLKLFAEDRGDLTLHESPRDGRIGQRTLFAARTVYLKKRELP